MGQIRHGGATTTDTLRRAIQYSQERLMVLAGRYNINPKFRVCAVHAISDMVVEHKAPDEMRSVAACGLRIERALAFWE